MLPGTARRPLQIYRQKGEEIDFVILDLIMPGIRGGETFTRLRDINPDVTVILSSGYSLDSQAKEVMDKGCRAFIQKPARVSKTIPDDPGGDGSSVRVVSV